MILLYTGDGKGKTTAALGQLLRVIGQGGKVALLQFIKSNEWPAGEDATLQQFKNKVMHVKGGRGFVGIEGDSLPREKHKKAAQKLLEKAEKIIKSKKYDLVILDEINVAVSLKLVYAKDIVKILKKVPDKTDIILTGRNATKQLINIADIATECKMVKHPYTKGIPSKKGREY